MACNLPSFFVHGILQAGILEWVAICFSWRYSWPRDWSKVSCIAGRFFTIWATGEEGGDNLLVTGSNDPNALFLILMNAPKILTINLPSLNNTSMVPHHHSIYTLLKKAYWEMDILIIFEQQILIFPRMIFIQWKTTLMLRFGVSQSVSSVTQLYPTLCDPMNHSTPGLPVHHQLLEFTQTHVHRVGDAIQPSHPLSSLSPPAPNPSQHQSLFQWVNSSHEVAKVLEFQL